MSENTIKTINWLSASKIKKISDCSMLYTGSYILKLPDLGNLGQKLGSLVHDLFELFGNKDKYLGLVNKINKTQKIPAPLKRLITKKLNKEKIYSQESLDKVIGFLFVGLKHDFYLEGCSKLETELYFELKEGFNVKGYIDRLGLYEKDGVSWVKILDFKSQKNKFSEKELDKNIQAYIYLLAAKKLYPNIKIEKSSVEFVLLKFPEDPIQTVCGVTDETLAGIKDYLCYIQKYIDNFTEEHAASNLAAYQDYPEKEDGFCGKIMCGRANFKGELKKDGVNKLWACSLKFPYDYFSLYEGEKLVKSAYTEAELLPVKHNQTIKQMHFAGCPAFNKKTVNIESEGFEF